MAWDWDWDWGTKRPERPPMIALMYVAGHGVAGAMGRRSVTVPPQVSTDSAASFFRGCTRTRPDLDFAGGFYSGSSSLGVTIGTTGSSSSAPVSASTTKRNGVWSFTTSTAYASV